MTERLASVLPLDAPARPADVARDVVVVGGGNAGICAALAARRAGARVLLLERSGEVFRGGNSRHTRDIRYAHQAADSLSTGAYPREEFLADLRSVSDDRSSAPLAAILADASAELPAWMSAQGVRWQGSLHGALHLSRTNAFFLGGGRALLNTYYGTAERLGVEIAYEADVVDLEMDGSACRSIGMRRRGTVRRVAPAAVVVAAGGIEANTQWLRDHWGAAADNFVVRGSATNDGTVLRMLLAAGAAPVGDERHFHAVAVDARSPRYDGGIVTRVDAVPYGIAVNAEGVRFHDEGETFWPKRYAVWGRLIAEQPGQVAWVLFDEKVRRLFIPPVYAPLRAASLPELAGMLPVPRERLLATVDAYNRATPAAARFDPVSLDGMATAGIQPPKSNWAQRIDTPPFYAYPLRPGITFTYAGVRVDELARVVDVAGRAFDNVFAAGELMAGNILTVGYLAGIGLTIGTVFGRIAGEEAARVAARRAH